MRIPRTVFFLVFISPYIFSGLVLGVQPMPESRYSSPGLYIFPLSCETMYDKLKRKSRPFQIIRDGSKTIVTGMCMPQAKGNRQATAVDSPEVSKRQRVVYKGLNVNGDLSEAFSLPLEKRDAFIRKSLEEMKKLEDCLALLKSRSELRDALDGNPGRTEDFSLGLEMSVIIPIRMAINSIGIGDRRIAEKDIGKFVASFNEFLPRIIEEEFDPQFTLVGKYQSLLDSLFKPKVE